MSGSVGNGKVNDLREENEESFTKSSTSLPSIIEPSNVHRQEREMIYTSFNDAVRKLIDEAVTAINIDDNNIHLKQVFDSLEAVFKHGWLCKND